MGAAQHAPPSALPIDADHASHAGTIGLRTATEASRPTEPGTPRPPESIGRDTTRSRTPMANWLQADTWPARAPAHRTNFRRGFRVHRRRSAVRRRERIRVLRHEGTLAGNRDDDFQLRRFVAPPERCSGLRAGFGPPWADAWRWRRRPSPMGNVSNSMLAAPGNGEFTRCRPDRLPNNPEHQRRDPNHCKNHIAAKTVASQALGRSTSQPDDNGSDTRSIPSFSRQPSQPAVANWSPAIFGNRPVRVLVSKHKRGGSRKKPSAGRAGARLRGPTRR